MSLVQISQYTVNPSAQLSADNVLEVRGFYTRSFIASDGVTPVAGNASNGQSGPYYSITPTLNGSGFLVVPAHDVQPTTESNPTGNYIEQLWVNGAYLQTLMPNNNVGTGWQIPTTYGSVIAFDEIATYNRAKRLVYAPETYFTADETIAEIRRLAGDFMYAAVGVNGITSMSVAPASASLPIAVGDNDPRLSGLPVADASTTVKGVTKLDVAPASATSPIAVGANSYASTSHLGITKLSVAPVSSTNPIAVGDNDPRITSGLTPAEGYFNASLAPYSLVPNDSSIDSSTAWQALIDDAYAYAVANGAAVIAALAGIYYIKNAIVPTATHNSQLLIPLVPKTSQRATVTITSLQGVLNPLPFRYPGEPSPTSGVIFESTLTGQTYSLTNGKPFIMGGPDSIHGTGVDDFSYVTPYLKGVTFRAPANPTIGGFNGEMLNRTIFEDCSWDTTDVHLGDLTQVVPSNPTGIAVLTPQVNTDGAIWLGVNNIVGWYAGFPLNEYTVQSGDVSTLQNFVNVNVAGSYYVTPFAESITSTRPKYHIAHVDPSSGLANMPNALGLTGLPVNLNMKMEDCPASVSATWVTTKDIYDPTNVLSGRVQYVRTESGTGTISNPLSNTGARGLAQIDLNNLSRNRILVYDSFQAADGTDITSRQPDIDLPGGAWSAFAGGFDVLNNRAVATSGAGSNVIIESDQADCVISVNFYTTATAGQNGVLIFRYSDSSNFWFVLLDFAGQTIQLLRKVAGVIGAVTSPQSVTPYSPTGANELVVLKVYLDGNNIRFLLNNYPVAAVSDSFNATATEHGFGAVGTTVTAGDFQVTP